MNRYFKKWNKSINTLIQKLKLFFFYVYVLTHEQWRIYGGGYRRYIRGPKVKKKFFATNLIFACTI
jgi:hypothetical protein